MRLLRRLAMAAGAAAFLGLAAGAAASAYLEQRAAGMATAFLDRFDVEANATEGVTALSRFIHERYLETSAARAEPLLLRLRPYLSNDLLPQFLQVTPGALETLYLEGHCDNAARTLIYILRQGGVSAAQLAIITPSYGHSMVAVDLPNGGDVAVDPFLGVVAVENGALVGAERARALAQDGVAAEAIWRLNGAATVDPLFGDMENAVFARRGDPLEWVAPVALEPGGVLTLGALNGHSNDVIADGKQHGLSGFWSYLGHRYDRAWVRAFEARQAMRVTVTLTEPLNPRFMVAEPAPAQVEGATLIFEIGAGERLVFRDGAARRDWLRLRSFQPIDQIRFEAL